MNLLITCFMNARREILGDGGSGWGTKFFVVGDNGVWGAEPTAFRDFQILKNNAF